jgi:transcriptional regulator GlxA family with amidase domain
VSRTGRTIQSDTGIELSTTRLDRVRIQAADMILVPGGPGVFQAVDDSTLVAWLRRHAPRASIVASTCTGAFLLAATGLLDGRRAVTHWEDCAELQRRYPAVHVEQDPIFIEDHGVWTSAGVTAGIDLALALVEKELGHQASVDLARRFVVYSKRPGGQSQFSNRLRQQVADETGSFEALHDWVEQNLHRDLRVEKLAEHVGMSPRTFYRAYTQSTALTPARMVARMRVETARRTLEETDLGVAAIAERCGFGTEEQMRRSFHRELGVSPSAYRETWRQRAISTHGVAT